MKLYIYDHCPFCIRARMIFGFKNIAIEQIVLLDNDIETPTRMIGRKMVPILQKEDGSYLPESLDIVRYVDGLNEPKFADGIISGEIEHWFKAVSAVVPKLVAPRFVEIDFPEVSTAEAKAAYVERTIKSYGDLTILRNETHTLLTELEPHMAFLDEWLENRGDVINIDDFIIFPILRSLSIVADLPFSTNIQKYMGSIATKTNVDLLFNKSR